MGSETAGSKDEEAPQVATKLETVVGKKAKAGATRGRGRARGGGAARASVSSTPSSGSPNVTQVSTPRSVSPVDMVTNKNEKLKQNKLQKLVSDKLAKVNTEEAATPNAKRK